MKKHLIQSVLEFFPARPITTADLAALTERM